MKTLQFAQMQKMRDFKVDFLKICRPMEQPKGRLMGRGYGASPQTHPVGTPALRASRASLGTFGPSICPVPGNKADL